MTETFQILTKRLVDGKVVEEIIITDQPINEVKSIEDLGFTHKEQIDIISGCQDSLLKAQSESLFEDIEVCPKCQGKLKFAGKVESLFHSVFSDHKVPVKRRKCCNKECGWTSVPSIGSLFRTNSHPDLSKLQTETAANSTYRSSQKILNAMSYYERKVNNHKHLHRIVEAVGNYISEYQSQHIPREVAASKELILQVDGGHLKTKDPDSRSFEALTSVIYDTENIRYSEPRKKEDNEKIQPKRAEILSKNCAASALDDNLLTIKKQTLLAAKKQGMTIETNVTALCDGAKNCWSVVESLEDQCNKVDKILDWFHIAIKFQNITLPKYLTTKFDKIKWCIWHGMSDEGINRFDEIITKTRAQKMKERLQKLKNYLINNQHYLVNYSERYKEGKLISSSLAESNVESLINQRCKGQQHMKWTREGVHPLLQVRAAISSNDWNIYGSKYVLNATTIAA